MAGVTIGVILINLGSPDEPTPNAVRNYLHEFLSDPHVIDIHPLARKLLLHLVILPFRPKRSAHAYGKIWTAEGSPLLIHTNNLAKQVGHELGKSFRVEFAMRYGKPTIESVIKKLASERLDKLIILPLFPQYSGATTKSITERAQEIISSLRTVIQPEIAPPFYRDPQFISAFTQRGKALLKDLKPNHIIFSFHGLPEQHIRKAESAPGFCLTKNFTCCSHISIGNANCYRAQCSETARLIARQLELSPSDYSITFQSRLGITPWIRPYTDKKLIELAKTGSKRVLVFCPAFVADCLETLEEIGIRGRDSFLRAGGERLVLVPSLNSEHYWAEAVANMVRVMQDTIP